MANKEARALCCLLAGGLLLSGASHADTGGRLERFEKDATAVRSTETAPPAPPPRRYDGVDSTSAAQADSLAFDMFLWVPVMMAAGGAYSWQRAWPATGEPTGEHAATPRVAGEGVIPYARADVSYQHAGSLVHAVDTRAEVGLGPFGFEARQIRYTESVPNAALEVQQYHALYRMSAGDHVEIDLGGGRLELSGLSRSAGPSWTLPILIHPSTRWGIEVRPSWASINGSSITNHELAVSLGDRFWAVRAGYHWLRSPNEQLDGPFLGLSVRL